MCTLCSKDLCITWHNLEVFMVSLQQGRYTFMHDIALPQVMEVLKTFISNIKEAVPISTKSSITLLKKGVEMPHKRTVVGIFHHASDWVFLTDLNSNYSFPVHIAFTQLRPNITTFSNSLRKVILIELTYPCEENIEFWHSTKINKYLALKTTIESHGWCCGTFCSGGWC